MENITKALYMAAGVFIGLLILSAFVWVFSNGGKFLASFEDSEILKQVEQYNAELLVYQKSYDATKPNSKYELNTIYDVVTAINKAKDINAQNLFDESNSLEINVIGIYTLDYENKEGGPAALQQLIPTYGQLVDPETLPEEDKDKRRYLNYFTGEIHYNNQTGKIDLITFTLN